jgi:hypothetical protein
MSLYPKDMVFHSSPVTVTIRGPSKNEGQAAAELTHPKRPARKSAASRKPKKAKVFIPPRDTAEHESKAVIDALNAASGGKNDRAAALAAEHMRGTWKGPSGTWVSCTEIYIFVRSLLIFIKQAASVFYAGKNRYIGTFDSREKAAFAYEIVREKLKIDKVQGPLDLEAAEAAVRQAQVAAYEAVGAQCPIASEKSRVQDPVARQKSKAVIDALNAASGGKNDRAAALAAEHMRGISKCPAGTWVSCTEIYIFVRSLLIFIKQAASVFYAGKNRYIGTFDSREKAGFAYEIVREKLKIDTVQRPLDLETVEAAVRQAQAAAFEAIGVQCPIAWEKSKIQDPVARQKSKAVIEALNAASGGKNDRAAGLAAKHMRGITKLPCGKWVSCIAEG